MARVFGHRKLFTNEFRSEDMRKSHGSLCTRAGFTAPNLKVDESVVPPSNETDIRHHVQDLSHFLRTRKKVVLLSGAGVRSPNGSYSKGHKPVSYSQFVGSHAVRQRYWARNLQGWPYFSGVSPNACHKSIALLERSGFLDQVVTQNVDRLHQSAGMRVNRLMVGSKKVVELHGTSHEVVCLGCKKVSSREELQRRMIEMNPSWTHVVQKSEITNSSRPDGGKLDGMLSSIRLQHRHGFFLFRGSRLCGVQGNAETWGCHGTVAAALTGLKFGENVPRATVDFVMDKVHNSDGLIAVGTSLEVWSAFRFVKAAGEKNVPIVILNIGPTRGDDVAFMKVEARLGRLLPHVVSHLGVQDIVI